LNEHFGSVAGFDFLMVVLMMLVLANYLQAHMVCTSASG